jgi:hypothetical protein
MMMPIGLALIAQLEAQRGGRRLRHFGGAIMLAVAYASNVGGIGTKIGTGTNSIFSASFGQARYDMASPVHGPRLSVRPDHGAGAVVTWRLGTRMRRPPRTVARC